MFSQRDDFIELEINPDTRFCARLHRFARTSSPQADESFRSVLAGSGAFVPRVFDC